MQRNLSARIITTDDLNFEPRYLCGMDAAYDQDTAYVAAAIWDGTSRRIVETASARDRVSTRYVPGFLGFREGPLLVRIVERLRTKPDVFLIDGQGFAHPRKFGLACHVGLVLNRPTIGVAKSRLYGRPEDSNIVDPDGEIIGRILATRCRKFYVSVGHRISLKTAANLVEKCLGNGHPSPLREAHLESMRAKRGVLN